MNVRFRWLARRKNRGQFSGRLGPTGDHGWRLVRAFMAAVGHRLIRSRKQAFGHCSRTSCARTFRLRHARRHDFRRLAAAGPVRRVQSPRLQGKYGPNGNATARLPTWKPEAAPGALRPLLDVWKVRHAIRECARKRPQCCRVIGEALLIELDRIALLERDIAPCRRRYSVDRLAVEHRDAVSAEIADRHCSTTARACRL